jgi:hypothetical protein
MFDPSKFIEGLKLPAKIVFALCIAAGLLLFPPDNILKVLGLELFVNANRPYIGGLFVITFCLLVVSALVTLAKFVKPWIVQAFWINQHKKRLQSLNPEEKEILAYYIQNQTRSQSLDYRSGIVNALEHEKIIYRGSNLGLYGFSFAYIIQPWAWEYLNENHQLLE